MIFNFLKPSQNKQANEVFNSALAQAKNMFPDRFMHDSTTVEQRREKFEAISIYMALYAWYLKEEGSKQAKKLSQDAYDYMFDLYEIALREQAVADMRVGPEVKKLASAFHGRLDSYGKSFSKGDTAMLSQGFVRNHVCGKEKAMGLSISIISEAKKMQEQSLESWLDNLKNLQKGANEPKEWREENVS